ncbi:hypothetical protein ACWGA9_40785 [Streptomyces sp. NPDC054950]
MAGRLRTIWEETPKITRTTCKVLPLLGALCLALGIIGDSRGWWVDRSFLTNLASSITGLFFGVPFALIVLSRLGEAQAEISEKREVRRFAARTGRELRRSVMEIVQPPLQSDPLLALDHISAELEQTIPDDDEDLGEIVFDKVLRLLQESFHLQQAAVWAGKAAAHWRTLDEDVRPRLAETDLQWITDEHVRRITQSLTWVKEHTPAFLLYVRDKRDAQPGRQILDAAWRRAIKESKAWVDAIQQLAKDVDSLAQTLSTQNISHS